MADAKISNDTAFPVGTPADSDKVAGVNAANANRKWTFLSIATYVITKLTGFLPITGATTGATVQKQIFTNGVETASITDSAGVSAIAVDARVLRDAAGGNNIDFSAVPLFLQGLKTNEITELTPNNGMGIICGGQTIIGFGTIVDSAFVQIDVGDADHAQLSLAPGATPTNPNDGDIWYDGTNLKMRVGGVTKTFTLI